MSTDQPTTGLSRSAKFRTAALVILPAIWPFLTFLDGNLNESFSRAQLGIYAAATVVILTIGYFLFRAVLCRFIDNDRIPVIYSAGVFAFFSYSITYPVASALFAGFYLKTWAVVFFAIFILSWILSKYRLFRSQVLIFVTIIVALPLVQIAGYKIQSSLNTVGTIEPRADAEPAAALAVQPGVYFIILDEYGRADVLKEKYGFDNAPYIENLEDRGFFVASQSTSNYPTTIASLSSVLAMEYWFVGETGVSEESGAAQMIYRNINPVTDYFRSAGYEIASFRWNGADCGDTYPDYCFPHSGLYFGDLESNLLKLTPFNSLVHVLFNDLLAPQYHELPDSMTFLENHHFNKPLFALIHALLPHAPYRFDANCEAISIENQLPGPDFRGYLENIKCANKSSLELVDTILERDPGSIIIIQSDHGPKVDIDWHDLELAGSTWRQSFSILNAWHIPKDMECHHWLSQDMTSVNTFRIVKNCLQETPDDLLQDRWFFVPISRSGTDAYSEIKP